MDRDLWDSETGFIYLFIFNCVILSSVWYNSPNIQKFWVVYSSAHLECSILFKCAKIHHFVYILLLLKAWSRTIKKPLIKCNSCSRKMRLPYFIFLCDLPSYFQLQPKMSECKISVWFTSVLLMEPISYYSPKCL